MKSEKEIKEKIKRIRDTGGAYGFTERDEGRLTALKWVLKDDDSDE